MTRNAATAAMSSDQLSGAVAIMPGVPLPDWAQVPTQEVAPQSEPEPANTVLANAELVSVGAASTPAANVGGAQLPIVGELPPLPYTGPGPYSELASLDGTEPAVAELDTVLAYDGAPAHLSDAEPAPARSSRLLLLGLLVLVLLVAAFAAFVWPGLLTGGGATAAGDVQQAAQSVSVVVLRT